MKRNEQIDDFIFAYYQIQISDFEICLKEILRIYIQKLVNSIS